MIARRRLHPATVIIDTVQSARNAMFGGGAAAAAISRGNLSYIALGVLAGFLFGTVGPVLRWWRFTWQVTADELVIEEGVLHRRRRSIPLERIQDISIEQGVIARALGVARVRIETGGGGKDDGRLESIRLADAHTLRARFGRGAAAQDEGAVEQHAEPLFAMRPGRVVLSGVLGFSPLLWGALLFEGGRRIARALDVDVEYLIGVAEHEFAPHVTLMLIAGAVAAVLALGMLVGVARALYRDYGFRLTHADGRFRTTRGLFQRVEAVIVDRRIRLALVRQPLLARVFGWCAVDFQTLGGSDGPSGRLEAAPLAHPDEAARVLAASGLPQPMEELEPVDARHGTRLAIRRSLLVVVPVAVGAWFTPLALLGLLLLVPIVIVSTRAPRFHRFAIADGTLHVAQGVVSRRRWIVPQRSVEAIRLQRGPLQRRFGLVRVWPDTAGGDGKLRPDIVDVRFEEGKALALTLLG